jgi:hypothetical protein
VTLKGIRGDPEDVGVRLHHRLQRFREVLRGVNSIVSISLGIVSIALGSPQCFVFVDVPPNRR